MTVRTARTPRRVRSLRLALVAGAALAVGTPALASADSNTDQAPAAAPTTTAPTGKGAATPTTVAGGDAPTTTAAAGTATTVAGSTPAAPAGTAVPLAEIDIAATGPGIEIGTAIDGATAVSNLQMANMPIAVGATVAEYSARFDSNLADPETPEYYGTLEIISTAQSDMPATDILAAYQAAIETQGTYETTTATASSEGVTSDRLTLDAVSDTGSATIGDYEIIVSRSEEQPGLVAIELTQTLPTVEGPLPALPATIAPDFASATDYATANGWTTTSWNYTDGFNQFFGGEPIKILGIDFSAGAGTAADLTPIGAQIIADKGTPSYEDVEDDRFFYSFDDESNWSGSWSEYEPGNELRITWGLTG